MLWGKQEVESRKNGAASTVRPGSIKDPDGLLNGGRTYY